WRRHCSLGDTAKRPVDVRLAGIEPGRSAVGGRKEGYRVARKRLLLGSRWRTTSPKAIASRSSCHTNIPRVSRAVPGGVITVAPVTNHRIRPSVMCFRITDATQGQRILFSAFST